MELQEICDLYKITIINNLYCLNDIVKHITKNKLKTYINLLKDKHKISNKYFIDAKTFRRIIYSCENDECKNIINMLNRKSDDKEDIRLLELQYKIECEKTKQLEYQKDIKIIDAKMILQQMEYDEMLLNNNYNNCLDDDCEECNCECDEEECNCECDEDNDNCNDATSELCDNNISDEYKEIDLIPLKN